MPEITACPKCNAPLAEITETPTGRKLRRWSKGAWNKETRQNEGCDYVLWIAVEPETLDEKCPKCGASLVLQVTRFGKKMKKCSTNTWDKESKTASGCDFVEWINGTTEKLDEKCPECGEPLVIFTTAKGKKLKKCSTSGWDRESRQATGCTYVEWLNEKKKKKDEFEDDSLPPPPEEEN